MNRFGACSYLPVSLVPLCAVLSLVLGGLTAPGTAEGQSLREFAAASARAYGDGDLPAAIQVLNSAIVEHPDNAQLRFMRGNAFFRQGNYPAAAWDLQEAATMRPVHADTHLTLGFAYYHVGDPEAAIDAWERAVPLMRGDAFPHLCLALAYRDTDRSRSRLHAEVGRRLEPEWKARMSVDMRWSPAMIESLVEVADHNAGDRRGTDR